MQLFVVVECALVVAVSGAIGVAVFRFVRNPRILKLLALLAVVWLLIDVSMLRESTILMRLIPWADMITLGSFAPIAAFVLAAVMLRLSSGRLAYRGSFAAILIGSCLFYSYGVLFRPKPPLHSRWLNGVCLQSSNASCSAAAAATLLALYGIPTTEAEMAELCFTGDDGTSMQGVYRGLKLKTAGTPWKVEPFSGDLHTLRSAEAAFLSVGLGRWQKADPRYSRVWGWAPGTMHSVVFLGFAEGGKVNVADPDVGREQWFEQGLIDLWKGEGFRLVRR